MGSQSQTTAEHVCMYTCTKEHNASMKKSEILPFATKWHSAKWNKLGGQRKTLYNLIYIWNLKNKWAEQNRNKLMETESKLMAALGDGAGDWVK